MEEIVTSTLETILSGVDKEVLIEIVKVIQKRGLSGSQGDWKKFLNSYDKKFGDSLSDPSKRSVDVLSTFIKCFNEPKYVKFFGDIVRQYTNYKVLGKYISESPDDESPQQKLVRLTLKHPLYRKHYSFQFFDDKDWVVVPTYYKSKGKNMIAVDCEMVLCHDDTEEVVEVCAVDKNLKVMLKTLVKPSKPVADYRTEITGVSAEDLEGVTCSFADMQKSMVKLLRGGTILVGHSVHSDLRVLKIVHHRVIDTAYIFKYSEGPPTCTPSLNRLCRAVLGYEVRKEGEPHNCRKDAEAAMRLVLAKLEHGFDDLINAIGVPEFNGPALLLHKIPVETSWQELHKIFPQNFNFEIKDNLKRQGSFYSTRAFFKDASEANRAFQNLKGQEEKMGKQREGGLSANWESNDVMIFCDLCVKEIELGNRPTTHFSKDGWNNLVEKFKEVTGKTYDKVQMKNKWDHLKKEWKLWHELKRGETGLGWNSSRMTIDASDKWWDERLQVVPHAKKFRYAGIQPELEEKMNIMFKTVVASGDNSCTPHSRNLTRESQERVMSDANDNGVEVNDVTQNTDAEHSSRPSKRRNKGKKKASTSGIDELVESSKFIGHCLMEPARSSCPYSLSQALEELDKHPDIYEDYKFYDFATMFLIDKNHREIFMSLREEIKVKWLRTRYMATS